MEELEGVTELEESDSELGGLRELGEEVEAWPSPRLMMRMRNDKKEKKLGKPWMWCVEGHLDGNARILGNNAQW